MKKNNNKTWGFPWGWIASVSFMLGLWFCNNAAPVGSAPIWSELMTGSMCVFGISTLIWIVKFAFRAMDIMKSSKLPWWWGL